LDTPRSIGRRSFFARVAGGALIAGAVLIFGETGADARRRVRTRRMLVDRDPHDRARPVPSSPVRHGRHRPRPDLRPAPPSDIEPPSNPESPSDIQPMPPPVISGHHGRLGRFVICPGNVRCPRRGR
jgi:hypothetical protein